MQRPTTRTALLPAVLLLSALTACAGGSPTGPSAPAVRRDGTTPPPPPPPSDSVQGNYQNPLI